MRNTPLAFACGMLLLAACSSSDDSDSSATTVDSVSTTAASTTAASTTDSAATTDLPPELDADGRVLFAETVNSFVLNTVIAYGENGLDTEQIGAAVNDVYPSLSLDGYAIEADGSNISIMSTSLVEKQTEGADNPFVVAVATRQVSGECFGAAVYGYPLPTERFDVTDLDVCTAEAVRDALVAELS